MTELNPDQRAASRIGIPSESVGIIRERWNDANETPIIREIITDRIQQLISELERKLRNPEMTIDAFRRTQGAIDAYEKAISTVRSRL